MRDEFDGQFLADQNSYYLFADHSVRITSFAIRLTPEAEGPHPVVAIGWDAEWVSVVAQSFDEFAERYLAGETSRHDLIFGWTPEPPGPA